SSSFSSRKRNRCRKRCIKASTSWRERSNWPPTRSPVADECFTSALERVADLEFSMPLRFRQRLARRPIYFRESYPEERQLCREALRARRTMPEPGYWRWMSAESDARMWSLGFPRVARRHLSLKHCDRRTNLARKQSC